MVCDVAEIAAGVGAAWARRDGAGAVVSVAVGMPVAAAVPGVVVVSALVASALSVLTALVSVDVEVLFSTVSAVAFVLVPSSVLPVSPFVASACSCCSAVS